MIKDMLQIVLGLNVPDPKHVKVFNAARNRLERSLEKNCQFDLATRVAQGVRNAGRKKVKPRTRS